LLHQFDSADKYNVYFNTVNIATKEGQTSHVHSSVASGTHTYYVTAIDDDKNVGKKYSVKSAIVAVTIGGGALKPEGFTGQPKSRTAIQFNWLETEDPAHDGRAKEFELYKNGTLLITTSNGNSFWLESGLSAGQTNTFHIVAVYPDGAKSAKAGPVTVKMPD